MMVGTMAEGATSAHALPPLEVRLRSPSKCSGDRPGGPGWSGGSGVGYLEEGLRVLQSCTISNKPSRRALCGSLCRRGRAAPPAHGQ